MASMVFEFRVLCLMALLPLGSFKFICPGVIYPSEGLSYAHIEPNISGRVTQEYAKIRIKPIYDPTIEGKPYKELVQKAADFWSNVVSVKPVSGPLFVAPSCMSEDVYKPSKVPGVKERYCSGSCFTAMHCEGFMIPQEHFDGCMFCDENGKCGKDDTAKGTGVENADLVLYVTAMTINNCLDGKTVAYAGPCQLDHITDRPLFAIINICPEAAAKRDSENLLVVIKHEIMHALGFGFFQFFRGSDGKHLWPRYENGTPNMNQDVQHDKVRKTIERDWHVRGQVIKTKRTFLVTPNVKREVRAYFDCPALEGAELEDFGGNGTQNGHFEARVFYDDGMKGNIDTGKGLFTRLDFAVLEDSGWYQVDYRQAEEMDFGRNLGCDFCMKSCKFWMDTKRKEGQSLEPYCDSPDLLYRRGFSCFGTKNLFSGCPLMQLPIDSLATYHDPKSFEPFDELPKKYQNFDNIAGVHDFNVAQCGSFDPTADFCPVPVQKFHIEGVDHSECEEEDESGDRSSQFGPSLLFVSCFTIINVMLLRVLI